jgi:hypothetical protein
LPVEAEVAGAVRDERVDLGEAAVVEQQVEALARRQLAPRVLLLDPCGSTRIACNRSSLSAVDTQRSPWSGRRLVGPAGIEPATVRL